MPVGMAAVEIVRKSRYWSLVAWAAGSGDQVGIAFLTRRMLGVGRKASAQTRTETQAMQNSQAAVGDALAARKPPWVKRSC